MTTFSGYDSQCLALERIKKNFPDFDYVLVAWSEIDKSAIIAHDSLFEEAAGLNYGDITQIDEKTLPDFDLFTMSSPCQDFSNAGKQAGGDEGSGTRSSLLWECSRIIEYKRPKYIVFENVSALISKKFVDGFNKWQRRLEGFGYVNFLAPSFVLEDGSRTKAGCINSKNMGVPQNRERVFLVSILRTADNPDPTFSFPQPFPLEKKLKDVLEEHVDEKYYLSDKMLEYFQRVNDDDSHGHKFKPTDGGGYATTVKANPAANADDNFVLVESTHRKTELSSTPKESPNATRQATETNRK